MTKRAAIGLCVALSVTTALKAEGVRLQLSDDNVLRGNSTLVQLRLIPFDQKVYRVRATVRYPGDRLVFKGAMKGHVSNAVKAGLRVETAIPSTKNAQVKVELTSVEPLAEGSVTELVFAIPESAELQTIELDLVAESYDERGKSLPTVVMGGKIKVMEDVDAAPLMGCFFFTH